MIKFIDKIATGFFDRLNYSVTHMSLPQWGIITGIALAIGIVMLKSKR